MFFSFSWIGSSFLALSELFTHLYQEYGQLSCDIYFLMLYSGWKISMHNAGVKNPLSMGFPCVFSLSAPYIVYILCIYLVYIEYIFCIFIYSIYTRYIHNIYTIIRPKPNKLCLLYWTCDPLKVHGSHLLRSPSQQFPFDLSSLIKFKLQNDSSKIPKHNFLKMSF